jgi:hypothetical protein
MKYFVYRLYTILRQHEDSCNFFDSFGIVIQCFLGLISLLFLVLKRYLEKPRRDWIIWALDTSKQVAGQLTQHGFNLIVSNRLGSHTSLECEWYVINLINDCTIGFAFQVFFLKLTENTLKGTKFEFRSGDYGSVVDKYEYLYQMFLWVTIVILVDIF